MAVSAGTGAAAPTRHVPVEDASQVGEVRRAALAIAERAGMDEPSRGRVGIAATELASNLARHARDGAVLLRPLGEARRGVELLAVDRGPGMDVARALVDGYSTGGTAGEGLGAVRRLADEFDAWSRPEAGTVLLARLADPRDAAPEGALAAGVCVAAPGEVQSGDAWALCRRGERLRLLVVDGLGHGPIAAEAAAEAVRIFQAYPDAAPADLITRLHDALRATRGAAAAVAEIVPSASAVQFAGVGNIGAALVGREGSRSFMSHNGIVGHQLRKVQEMTYPWSPDAVLVMTSDGLRSQWRLDEYPGLAARHPATIAGVLFRDFLRGRDDATVVVVRGSAPAPL